MSDTTTVNLNRRPELTIITPVYKTEKYLRSCLDSVLSQTFVDWELILVDDGSPDNSGMICDEYALSDSRIKVLHKANAGASAARNDALDMAAGKYVTFLDSDDEYGEKTTLEDNMAVLRADPSIDFLQFPHVYMDNVRNSRCAVTEQLLTARGEVLGLMLEGRIPGYCCTKIFRAGLFDGMRFPVDVVVTEDLWLLIDLVEKANAVYLSEKGLYVYWKRDNSLSVFKTKEKERQCAHTYRKLLASAESHGVDSSVSATYFFRSLSHLLSAELLFGEEYFRKEIEELLVYMPDWKLLSGRLKTKYKLQILQIGLLGFDRFARLNIHFKRRRMSAQKNKNSICNGQ